MMCGRILKWIQGQIVRAWLMIGSWTMHSSLSSLPLSVMSRQNPIIGQTDRTNHFYGWPKNASYRIWTQHHLEKCVLESYNQWCDRPHPTIRTRMELIRSKQVGCWSLIPSYQKSIRIQGKQRSFARIILQRDCKIINHICISIYFLLLSSIESNMKFLLKTVLTTLVAK